VSNYSEDMSFCIVEQPVHTKSFFLRTANWRQNRLLWFLILCVVQLVSDFFMNCVFWRFRRCSNELRGNLGSSESVISHVNGFRVQGYGDSCAVNFYSMCSDCL
jgi:hypothetical protein